MNLDLMSRWENHALRVWWKIPITHYQTHRACVHRCTRSESEWTHRDGHVRLSRALLPRHKQILNLHLSLQLCNTQEKSRNKSHALCLRFTITIMIQFFLSFFRFVHILILCFFHCFYNVTSIHTYNYIFCFIILFSHFFFLCVCVCVCVCVCFFLFVL